MTTDDGATIQRAYDEADLARAITAYKFFYPTVSGARIIRGNEAAGLVANKVFGVLDCGPTQLVFTANSDTPYGPLRLDLGIGPLVVELEPGPLIVVAMDVNQRWVADMGLPGPDAGNGGKHLLVGPDFVGELPDTGYYLHRASSNQQIVGARSLPVDGDVDGAMRRLKTIKVYPLHSDVEWTPPQWFDLTGKFQDTTPLGVENGIEFWRVLHETVDAEPAFEGYRTHYGELAALGIAKGQPFDPDQRMIDILTAAAQHGNAQPRAQSFADRSADRHVWDDRQWEHAALRFEDGDFNATTHVDLVAREKWFYQAIGASPAMFRRDTQAGSLYWLGHHDHTGAPLEGANTYRLTVPLPVPARLFWSVTVYDVGTRSQIQTPQNKAALRSLFELQGLTGGAVDLYFGPAAPAGHEHAWIQTISGKNWFTYFRIYGPQAAAFNGHWRPGDFERI